MSKANNTYRGILTTELGYPWFKDLKKLRDAKGYDRNRLLKHYSQQAGKLIAAHHLNADQAKGMLIEACRRNRLFSTPRWVLKIIDRFIEKGTKE